MKKMATALRRFIPRAITVDMAAEGYNNQGRGKLVGYISAQQQHETACPYFKNANKICACRIGLWKDDADTKPKRLTLSPRPRRAKAKT